MSWLVDTLFVTGALILVVLVLRRPVTRWFGPGLAYALWLLPLLRLVLPPITLPQEVAAAEPLTLLVEPATVVANTAPSAPGWDFAALALPLWLGGALAFLAWRAWGYAAMRRRLLDDAVPVGEIEGVRMIESPAAPAPVAFGLLDKVIALPPGFMAQADLARRDLAIAHELEHHRGRDLAVNVLVQPLFALHWFNPLAWAGWRALRRDQEAACDARVLAGSGPGARAEYGRLIASFASGPRLALAAPMACPISIRTGLGEKSIVHRLRSLTMTEPTPKRRVLGRTLVGVAALALPLTASITYAASDDPPANAEVATPAPQVEVRRHVIIIDNPKGSVIDPANPDAHDPNLHTRVVERDGRTIVLKTTRELTDAEAEEHIARAEASIPDMPDVPPTPGNPAAGDHRVRQFVLVRREGQAHDASEVPFSGESVTITGDNHASVVRIHGGEDGGTTAVVANGQAIALACADGAQQRETARDETTDGVRRVVRMRVCNNGGTPEQALSAMRRARERVAANTEMSAQIRDQVLEQLDAEIARLSATD